MSQIRVSKIVLAALAALLVITSLSCSGAETSPVELHSAGRGAKLTVTIPWEMWRNPDDIEAVPPREIKGYPEQHWLVGPLDAQATGGRLKEFLGAARNGATPNGVEPLKV